MFKKLATFLLSTALLLSTASVARAQEQWWEQSPQTSETQIQTSDPNTVDFRKYVRAVTSEVLNSFSSGSVSQAGLVSAPGGAVAQVGGVISMMVGNPPVQTREYLAYMGAKAGINQAYAQAGGFSVLKPVQGLWVATRNVAYLITSLTLVVIGFMIMMRKKLDAQTVIGIQQALPSIVITLLLITFSYAIAGFVVDLIYFVIYFVIQLFGSGLFADSPPGKTAIEILRNKSLFSIGLQDLFGVADKSAAEAIGNLIQNIFKGELGGFITGAIGGVVKSPIGNLIVSGALLFAAVKLFFALLTSYAMLLMSTIFGPLMLMTNAIPGSNSFGTWIKNLLGNAAVFPATAIFLVLAAALMGSQSGEWGLRTDIGYAGLAPSETAWSPPLLFGTGADTAGSNPAAALQALIGLGMFLLAPQFVEMVKKAFQTAGGEGYGSAIGQALQYGYKGQYSPMGALTGGKGVVGTVTGAPGMAVGMAGRGLGMGTGAVIGAKEAGQYGLKGWRKAAHIAGRALGVTGRP